MDQEELLRLIRDAETRASLTKSPILEKAILVGYIAGLKDAYEHISDSIACIPDDVVPDIISQAMLDHSRAIDQKIVRAME